MSIADIPENRNFLSPLNFQFRIKKTPNVNFFLQKVKIPSISLQSTIAPNPFVDIPYPGDHIKFGSLEITFKVDEDLQNYQEIFNWIVALGKPQWFGQYKAIESQQSWTGLGINSDISVFALSGSKKPTYEIIFVDAFPTKLSEIDLITDSKDITYVTAAASFDYTYYKILPIVD